MDVVNVRTHLRVAEDLPHLQIQGLSRNRNTRNAGMANRVRRRSLESPVPSKKRRLSEGTSPFTEGLSMPASKSPRTSTGLRSFR
ncbi:hypothetical protein R1sor_004091 [Riccia sorocarpa]|uniref:Uncharacterized protein n=1 Tax=Riccia sorocarpa TaxID=122646 RepID=A0ABD3H6B6_9MARC